MMDLLLTLAAAVGHPLAQAIQVQASFVLIVGILGWSLAGFRKRQEAQRLNAAGYAAVLQQVRTCKSGPVTAETGAARTSRDQDLAEARLAENPSSHVESADSSVDGSVAVEAVAAACIRSQTQLHIAAYCKDSITGDMAVQSCRKGQDGVRSKHQLQQRRSTELLSTVGTQQQQRECASARCQQAASTVTSTPVNAVFKSHTGQQAGVLSGWPSLAVVCPVKGCRPHSRQNWETQLAAHYGGRRIFIFVVESQDDAAVAALREMMTQQQQQQQLHGDEQKLNSVAHVELAEYVQIKQQAEAETVKQRGDTQQQHSQPQHQFSSTTCVLNSWRQGPGQMVLLVNAGLTTTCSQKIHNILAGAEVALPVLQQQQAQQQQGSDAPKQPAAECSAKYCCSSDGYVCVLDDDVALHPLSLMQLVDELEADQSLFMVTGYPHDIVTAAPTSKQGGSRFWGRLWSYAAAAYHLPLCIGFSVADRGGFVWGGVMVLRAPYLQAAAAAAADVGDEAEVQLSMEATSLSQACTAGELPVTHRSNLLQVWRDGGYSDDLLLSGFCAAHKLSIGLPVSAYFPQLLPPACTFKQYWNYLRRQLFVLDTYYSQHNRRLNHTMMALHSYGSALFTGATLITALQLLLLMLAWVQSTVLSLQSISSSHQCSAEAALAEDTAAASNICHSNKGITAISVVLSTQGFHMFSICTLLSLLSISYMNSEVRRLFRVLSPDACHEVLQCDVSVIMLWLGWIVENAILPYCTLYCYLCDHIVWGGITYHKKNGKINKIVHPK